ncbi:MAG: helicase-related protein, partial [Selenomonadaceae bacterium]
HRAEGELPAAKVIPCKPFYPPELIVQDELHLITGPLGTIYGGYETVIEEMCSVIKDGRKIKPKYVASTATIKNAEEQIKALYARKEYFQFPPDGLDISDSFFVKEISLPEINPRLWTNDEIQKMAAEDKKPFRQYAGICASGQSVKTTLIRLYSIILQKVLDLSEQKEYADYVDPYWTLIGYFNSLRELGGARRLLDDDITHRIHVLKNKYGFTRERYLNNFQEITSRMRSTKITQTLERLATEYHRNASKQECYDAVIATNMIAVGMDVDRLGLMIVAGQPKQNSEYIQATSRVGRKWPGLIFTVYNPYRPRDLSNYENFTGFHSQMYRYVEGTTATPFAARARDRDLHALVVSLLRLQYEEFANNNGASQITSSAQEEIDNVKDIILKRVSVIAPDAYEDTKTEIENFISDWKSIASSSRLYYSLPSNKNGQKLLVSFEDSANLKEKPTLRSMRDVEQASTLYYYSTEAVE